MSKLSVKEVNQLAENEFQEIFGNIIECYPKTAEFLYKKRPFENEREMLQITLKYLHELPLSGEYTRSWDFICVSGYFGIEKGKILQLHPDLAGKLAQEGQLTHESTEEQKAAGLNKLTLLQKKEMDYLNNQYVHDKTKM